MLDLLIWTACSFALGYVAGHYGFRVLWEKVKTGAAWVRARFDNKPVA